MGRYAAGRDLKLYDAFIALNTHVNMCRSCSAARRVSDPHNMCDQGMKLTLDAAHMYSDMARLRRQAHSNPNGVIYACPEPSKHGKVYAALAVPLYKRGDQDTIF